MRKLLPLALVLLVVLLPLAANGDGLGDPGGPTASEGPRTLGGVRSVERGTYRYVTTPSTRAPVTFVGRIDKRDGSVDRWWHLHGKYVLPEVSFDGSSGAISADGSTLVVATFPRSYPPKMSRFAVIDTNASRHAVSPISLQGAFTYYAQSADGSRIYLTHYFYSGQVVIRWEIQAVDAATGELLPGPIVDPEEPGRRLDRTPITQLQSQDGRWAYTLYGAAPPFLYALDTVDERAVLVDLPQLKGGLASFRLRMKLSGGGSRIEVYPIAKRDGGARSGPGVEIDTRSFEVSRPAPQAQSSMLAFAQAPRRPGNLLGRAGIVGHSAQGRPIEVRQVGDPKWPGKLLVFGCIHGDECGASSLEPTINGCPDPSADILIVPDLDPDGSAVRSRLNARGVDLNRNFPSQWQAMGQPGDPQYSGPRQFSEPETRLAARIIQGLEPAATIWFHQYRGARPFVRAWGQSVAGGRHFAALARMPFRLMRWPAGTGPNWQNHRFRAPAFVVELPQGKLAPAMRGRLGKALVRMGRWVRED